MAVCRVKSPRSIGCEATRRTCIPNSCRTAGTSSSSCGARRPKIPDCIWVRSVQWRRDVWSRATSWVYSPFGQHGLQ
jgi:hypothetical protein